jgi:hypothetical protein
MRFNNPQICKENQHLLSESQQNRGYSLMGFNPSPAIVGYLKIKRYEIISFSSYNLEKWRDDFKCGPMHPLQDGSPAQCDPNGYGCCSPGGWCGKTPAHCSCSGCIDYTVQGKF